LTLRGPRICLLRTEFRRAKREFAAHISLFCQQQQLLLKRRNGRLCVRCGSHREARTSSFEDRHYRRVLQSHYRLSIQRNDGFAGDDTARSSNAVRNNTLDHCTTGILVQQFKAESLTVLLDDDPMTPPIGEGAVAPGDVGGEVHAVRWSTPPPPPTIPKSRGRVPACSMRAISSVDFPSKDIDCAISGDCGGTGTGCW
jgi:hypothetical protein